MTAAPPPSPYPPPGYPPQHAPPAGPQPRTSGLAIASLILGALAMVGYGDGHADWVDDDDLDQFKRDVQKQAGKPLEQLIKDARAGP